MRHSQTIQNWKDPDHRGDGVDRNHPAGEIELDQVGGSLYTNGWVSIGCCPGGTQFAGSIGCCNGDTFGCWPVPM